MRASQTGAIPAFSIGGEERINSQAGVQAFGQLVFGYSTADEDLVVEYVRVRKTDGQVVETPSSTSQDFGRWPRL